MLVFTVKEDEEVTIYDAKGNELGKVRVNEIQGGKVRLGFDFPKNIPIARPGVTREQAISIASKQ